MTSIKHYSVVAQYRVLVRLHLQVITSLIMQLLRLWIRTILGQTTFSINITMLYDGI